MSAPWEADVSLDAAVARTILAAELPALQARQVIPFGEGWDFTTFLIDDESVARFAKRDDSSRRFAGEVRILAELAVLDLSPSRTSDACIALPCYQHVILTPSNYPFAIGAYPLLPGVRADDPQHADLNRERIGGQLGAWLKRLHACTPVPAPRRIPEYFAADLVEFRESLRELRPALSPELAQSLARMLNEPYRPASEPPRFCHADLGMEHVLVGGPQIRAVIDWTDARWDDPLTDFAGLWAWGGDTAVRAARQHYGQPLTPAQWAMLRWRGACHALGQAHYGYFAGRADEFAIGVGQLMRMHDAGQLDDVHRPET